MPAKPTGLTGAAGEYYVAAELSRRGWLATVTIKNAPGTDVLAQNVTTKRTVAIQTKTSSGGTSFTLGPRDEVTFKTDPGWMVFVGLHSPAERPSFFVIPRCHLATMLYAQHHWPSSRSRPWEQGRGHRRRRGRAVRRRRREAARRRADHHHGPPRRPDRARTRVRRHRRRQRARRGGGRARDGADRRPRRPLGARVRRNGGRDAHGGRDRPSGGAVGRVGVPHYEAIPAAEPAFYGNMTVGGGPAPARAYIDELLPDILEGRIEPGRVFDRVVDLDHVPDGYRAMNEREALKVMVNPS